MFPPLINGQPPKLDWKQKEMIEFLEEKATYFDESVKNKRHDGLMMFMSGHGIQDHIISADGFKIEKNKIHRIFSEQYPAARDVPRLFCFDSCSGDDDKKSSVRGESEDESVEHHGGKGIKKRKHSKTSTTTKQSYDNDNGNDVSKGVNLEKDRTLSLEQTYGTWNRGENNPDFRLIKISAANLGFQAKMNSVNGSYLIAQFVERLMDNIVNGNKLFIGEIMDKIQTDLHDNKEKQQTVHTFNNETQFVRFVNLKHAVKETTETENHIELATNFNKKK
eukprot:303955_1